MKKWGTQILILGGTGSWGQQLTKTLLTDPKISSITIFSRNEFNQVQMQRNFNESRLKFVIGDIRDYEAVYNACFNKNKVYLLSALKHVPVCEEQPEEAIKTNIIGTQNVIKASIEQNVETVVDVSSDKSTSANTLYGATKFIGEKLILNANKLGDTSFICIRAGNVLGTAGSVVPLFIDQIKNTNTMTVTDGSMTRYFMSLPEAINLLLTATNIPRGSLLVMKMNSCTIGSLADTMKDVFGNKDTIIKEVGARPSEKKHEMLVSSDEAPNCYEYNKDYYIISNDKLDLPKVKFEYYSSNSQPLMNKEQIKEMLNLGGFLK
ncbi:MAG: polysaccharide biosynthesis protein [Patescibacteria group bacterium]